MQIQIQYNFPKSKKSAFILRQFGIKRCDRTNKTHWANKANK